MTELANTMQSSQKAVAVYDIRKSHEQRGKESTSFVKFNKQAVKL